LSDAPNSKDDIQKVTLLFVDDFALIVYVSVPTIQKICHLDFLIFLNCSFWQMKAGYGISFYATCNMISRTSSDTGGSHRALQFVWFQPPETR
jgi:hypothetical protein